MGCCGSSAQGDKGVPQHEDMPMPFIQAVDITVGNIFESGFKPKSQDQNVLIASEDKIPAVPAVKNEDDQEDSSSVDQDMIRDLLNAVDISD